MPPILQVTVLNILVCDFLHKRRESETFDSNGNQNITSVICGLQQRTWLEKTNDLLTVKMYQSQTLGCCNTSSFSQK